MNATATVRGTLNADGTLLLEQSTGLPPGPVEVTVKTMPTAAEGKESVWDVLDRIWAEQKEDGRSRRTAEEIDAELQEMRDEWEEHDLQIERLQDEGRAAREAGGNPED